MKTKKLFFFLCLGLGIMILVTSCDSKKESYNCSDSMQKYLIQREDSVIKIFVKNDGKKCYDSLAQFPALKYAEIENEQIAYILDHPDQSLVKKQTYADCWFDGVFLKYTKIELVYILEYKNNVWSQKEINDKERSGIVWSWIISWGLIIGTLLFYFFCAIYRLATQKKYEVYKDPIDVNNIYMYIPAVLAGLISWLTVAAENTFENFAQSLLIGIIIGGVTGVVVLVIMRSLASLFNREKQNN